MKIKVKELREVANILFDHLEECGVSEQEIEHDYYWDIPTSERYDVSIEPSNMTIGQLTDDWAELQKILKSPDTSVAYALVWYGAIIRAMGENTPC